MNMIVENTKLNKHFGPVGRPDTIQYEKLF